MLTLLSVNNDFHNTHDLFKLFDDLTVKDLHVEVPGDKSAVNGATETNGVHQNGTADIATKN